MHAIIRLDLVKDEQLKKGLEKLDDCLGYFLGIEHHSEEAKAITQHIYAVLKMCELMCQTVNVEHDVTSDGCCL